MEASIAGLPIAVRKANGIPKSRTYIRLGQLTLGGHHEVHNNSLKNVLRGLVERVYTVEGVCGRRAPTPRPRRGAYARLCAVRAELLRCVDSCLPYTTQEFLDTYRGAKHKGYVVAAESLSSRAVCKADAILRTFVKAEKISKLDPAARLIQPRGRRYNMCVGKYLKRVEKPVYRAIARVWGGPTVMKGFNAVETASHIRMMWDQFRRPCGVGLDASRFDQHVSSEALRWEHSVYNSIFQSKELRELLSWQLKNTGFAITSEGVAKYEVDGCRMSGDMNTSLGNCLLMCAMVLCYARFRRVPCRLANNGDDCMVIMDRRHVRKFREGLREWFLELGFNMKVENTVHEFERVEFCQTRPVLAAGRWVMTRDFRRCLDRDTMCLYPDSIPYETWLDHVGTAGGALASGVPVLQTYYRVLRKLGKPGKTPLEYGNMDFAAERMRRGESPVTSDARVSFYKAYGVPPWTQEALEMELEEQAATITVGTKAIVQSPAYNTHILNVLDGWLKG